MRQKSTGKILALKRCSMRRLERGLYFLGKSAALDHKYEATPNTSSRRRLQRTFKHFAWSDFASLYDRTVCVCDGDSDGLWLFVYF